MMTPMSPSRSKAARRSSQWWLLKPAYALFAAWTVCLAVASCLDTYCSYHRVRHDKSTPECIALWEAPGTCHQGAEVCLGSNMVVLLSPHWLGKGLVTIGPLLLWIPLALLAARRAPRRLAVLALPMLTFLAISMPLRYLRALTGWDPSGHVLVGGIQLAPLWLLHSDWLSGRSSTSSSNGGVMASAASPPPPPPRLDVILVWAGRIGAALLWYITTATAAFYHSFSEVATAWAVVAALMAAMQHASHQPPATTQANLWRALRPVALVWLLCTLAVAILLPQQLSLSMNKLGPFVLHDLLVAALACGLVLYSQSASKK